MTPLPKRRLSTRRQGKRRAALRFALPNLFTCSNCGGLKPAYQTCPACGFYKGRLVAKIRVKKEKRKES